MLIAYKEYRKLTITEQFGYKYKPTLTIRIQGRGLMNLAFIWVTGLRSSARTPADDYQGRWDMDLRL